MLGWSKVTVIDNLRDNPGTAARGPQKSEKGKNLDQTEMKKATIEYHTVFISTASWGTTQGCCGEVQHGCFRNMKLYAIFYTLAIIKLRLTHQWLMKYR